MHKLFITAFEDLQEPDANARSQSSRDRNDDFHRPSQDKQKGPRHGNHDVILCYAS